MSAEVNKLDPRGIDKYGALRMISDLKSATRSLEEILRCHHVLANNNEVNAFDNAASRAQVALGYIKEWDKAHQTIDQETYEQRILKSI